MTYIRCRINGEPIAHKLSEGTCVCKTDADCCLKPPTSDEGYDWRKVVRASNVEYTDRDFDGLPPAEPDLRLAQHGWRHHLLPAIGLVLGLAICAIVGVLLFGAPCDRASNFAPANGRYCK